MNILLVNNHHKHNGGAESYYLNLGRLLLSKGHQVAYFSMKDRNNIKTKWNKYFVSNVDPNRNGFIEIFKKIPRIFYSVEAKNKVSVLLDKFKPDLVHINNIYYHISPSIVYEIKRRGIPIVQTVHDYQIISPNVIMFHNGKICETTKGQKYYKAIFHKCVGNSYIGSLLSVISLYIQDFNNFYRKNIDAFIAPSRFMKRKLISYGFSKKRVFQLNNYVNNTKSIDHSNKTNNSKYILYFGRLSEAKGIYKLVKLAKSVPNINIVLAGKFDEPLERKSVMNIVRNQKIKNLIFVGFKNKTQLNNLIKSCEFVIVPSIWYENQPYSILESYAFGKPVVASRIGGNPEIVVNSKTGLLFNIRSSHDFKTKVLLMWNNNPLTQKMGKNAYNFACKNFSAEIHYENLMRIYNAVGKKK